MDGIPGASSCDGERMHGECCSVSRASCGKLPMRIYVLLSDIYDNIPAGVHLALGIADAIIAANPHQVSVWLRILFSVLAVQQFAIAFHKAVD